MPRRILRSFLCAMLMPLAAAPRAHAGWPEVFDPPVFLTAAAGDQSAPASVSDGASGAIVVWQDARPGALGYDIYVQRVSADGVPLWTADGVALCTATGNQTGPAIMSDGTGGAIVAWMDDRAGTSQTDIYVQRVGADGIPQWAGNGVPVGAAAGWQFNPVLATDGAGGAIVAWEDWRSSTPDIYAQRVASTGITQWTANGVAVCTATNSQYGVSLDTDASGGAVIAWVDLRGFDLDIYAQRLNAAGTPQWTANGIVVCNALNDQRGVRVVANGFGGALMAWEDERNSLNNPDIYAQHVTAAGGRLWQIANNGIALTTAIGAQTAPRAVTDGSGGVIVAWTDLSYGDGGDIQAQRIAGSGVVLWTPGGAGVWVGSGEQSQPALIPDGAGGAIVTFRFPEFSPPYFDVYVRRMDPNGVPGWTSLTLDGSFDQVTPALVPDGAGGAIAVCRDGRNGNNDISAKRIANFGLVGTPEPVITSVADLPGDQGGFVRISWLASFRDSAYQILADYRLWRSVPTGSAAYARMARARGVSGDPEVAAREGRLLVGVAGASSYAWEEVAVVPATHAGSYVFDAPTTSDSIAGSNPLTAFMVQARDTGSGTGPYWYSWPDSGYSVDNLAPATPSPFTGEYVSGVATLHWDPNTEADLAGYRVYRGSTPDFVTGPGNLLTAQPDTGLVDDAGAAFFYKLVAVDVHGNESPPALYSADGTTDVPGLAAGGWALAPPAPNPARGRATLHFALPHSASVTLALFDPAGRRVRTLHQGPLAPGLHMLAVELADDGGRPLPSGMYLLRLEAPGRVLTRRMVAIR